MFVYISFFVVGMTWMYDPICRKLIHGWKVILLEEVAELAMANQVDNFYWVFYFCLSKKWSDGGQKRWTTGNVNAKTTWQIVAFAEIIKRLDRPCSRIFGSAVFLNPILHWCEESFLNEFWKRSCLSSSSYVGVAKVLMNSERRLYKTSLSYFRLFSPFYQKQLKTSV